MFEYTGQKTTYEEWRKRNAPMQPRLYIVHDVESGTTVADVSRSRDKEAARQYNENK